MKKILALVLALALALSLCALAGCSKEDGGSGSGSDDGKIDMKIVLIDKDDQQYTYDLHVTDGASLRDALYEAELITEETYYAMFVENIDGHVADVLNDGCTWLPLDENGEQIMGSFDEITVSAGEVITLQYYVVPMMD